MSNVINLNVEKEILVLQNKVLVSVKITHQGVDRLEIQEALKQKIHQLFSILKLEKYSSLESFTQQQKILPQYRQNSIVAGRTTSTWEDPTVIDSYIGEIYVGISTENFEQLHKALEETQHLCELCYVHTSVSPDKMKNIEKTLTKQAIVEFNEKAKLISQSFQFNFHSLQDITVGSIFSQNRGHAEMAISSHFQGQKNIIPQGEKTEPLFYIEPKRETLCVKVHGTIQIH